jgi:hypothetical protein
VAMNIDDHRSSEQLSKLTAQWLSSTAMRR